MESFQLTRPKNGKRMTTFENNDRKKQGRLFVGCDDLPGQQTLFTADGYDRAAVPVAQVERVFDQNPSADVVVWALTNGDDAIIHRGSPQQCDRVPQSRRGDVLRGLVLSGKRVAVCEATV